MINLSRCLVVSSVFALFGCVEAPEPTSQPIQAGYTAEFEEAERHGRLIHAKDVAAAFATDAVLDIRGDMSRVMGWITVAQGNAWLVRFLTTDAKSAHDVLLRSGQPPEVLTHSVPADVPPDQKAMFSARQTATKQHFQQCSDRYNTVVFPSDSRNGWTVYLLAATPIPGRMIVGGHHRFEISADGKTVLSAKPLSRACLTMDEPLDDENNVVARYVTHIVSKTPVATHVFLNLLHGLPLLVGTEDGLWAISDGKIFPPNKQP